MSQLAKSIDTKYTYYDYLKWSDDHRWEIIEGIAYNMSPAPSIKHQRISWNIKEIFILNKSKLKECIVFDAPTDVVLDEFNVVQPDIFIVCNKEKITEKNISGSPVLIIEIVSKSTAYKDTKIKKDIYEKFKIKEYILIFQALEIAEQYLLEDNKYRAPEIYNWDEVLKLKTFNIEIPLCQIFNKNREE